MSGGVSAGLTLGRRDLAQVDRFHARMDEDLAGLGAHIDEFRRSPYHPEGAVPAFRLDSECRKPKPGMIHDLAAAWPIDMARSALVGDRESDLAAAASAGLRGVLSFDGDLERAVEALLPGG